MIRVRHLENRLLEYAALHPDLSRGLRAALILLVPLAICHALHRPPADATFLAMAAQNLALPDLRGAYRVRLTILGTMTVVAALSALLGVVSAGSVYAAVAGMGLVAVLGGAWRHLSADYGPSLAVSSGLLFLLGLAQRGGLETGRHLAGLVVLGGAAATLVHAGFWLFRPQHPLRYAVAETWVAVSDLVASMRAEASGTALPPAQQIGARERELRAALDRTFIILGGAEKRQPTPLIAHLEEMRREVVHLAMRAIALNTALEPLLKERHAETGAETARCLPVLDSVLKALSDAARSVAITIIIYRPQNFAASSIRLRRCQHLIGVLDEQLAALPASCGAAAHARAALHPIVLVLPRIRKALGETADHSPARFQFPYALPELSARSIQSLAAWMNPAPQIDPVLVRYTARIAVLTMAAVALYEAYELRRGYWMAFTMLVVLQPDYGSTRQRAVERIGGTVAGVVAASALLWIQMPLYLLDALAAAMSFGFAYYLKKRYALAVFFVTLVVVLVTETATPVRLEFVLDRVRLTLIGGGVSLLAALAFWPSWERDKFSVLLAAAVRANRDYLDSLRPWLSTAPPPAAAGPSLMAKRQAENANRAVAASLERILAEPASRQVNPERAAALATYNQRVTRALTLLAVHLHEGARLEGGAVVPAISGLEEALERLAVAVEKGFEPPDVEALAGDLLRLEEQLGTETSPSLAAPAGLIVTQMAKIVAELRAMTLAIQGAPAG